MLFQGNEKANNANDTHGNEHTVGGGLPEIAIIGDAVLIAGYVKSQQEDQGKFHQFGGLYRNRTHLDPSLGDTAGDTVDQYDDQQGHNTEKDGNGQLTDPSVIKLHGDKHTHKSDTYPKDLSFHEIEAVLIAAEGIGVAGRKVHDDAEQSQNDDQYEENGIVASFHSHYVGGLDEVALGALAHLSRTGDRRDSGAIPL